LESTHFINSISANGRNKMKKRMEVGTEYKVGSKKWKVVESSDERYGAVRWIKSQQCWSKRAIALGQPES